MHYRHATPAWASPAQGGDECQRTTCGSVPSPPLGDAHLLSDQPASLASFLGVVVPTNSRSSDFRSSLGRTCGSVCTGVWTSYERLRNPRLWWSRIPAQQLRALAWLRKVQNNADEAGIEVFLLFGGLLGAMRQGAFAGRPADVDIGVFVDASMTTESVLSSLKGRGIKVAQRKRRYERDLALLELRAPRMLKIRPLFQGSVRVFRLDRETGCYLSICASSKHGKELNPRLQFSPGELLPLRVASVLGLATRVPCNAEDWLVWRYGPEWLTPDKPQAIVRQPHVSPRIRHA